MHLAFDPTVLNNMPMVADGSDPGFANEMLTLFITNTANLLLAMEQAANEGNMPTLTRLVHSLKSSAAQVGAMALSDQAKQQEALLREGKLPPADWHARLRLAFEQFQQAREVHRQALRQNV